MAPREPSELEVLRPTTLTEVLDALAASDPEETLLWGGGTASAVLMRQGLLAPRRLILLEAVPELKGLTAGEDGLTIGAATRLVDLERSALLRRLLPSLAATAGLVGNVRVRNVATLGGSLVHADPAEDLPPLLVALGARAVLHGPEGARSVALEDFFRGPLEADVGAGEVLVAVRLPREAFTRRSAYVKYTPGSREDYAVVGVAASLAVAPDGTVTDARLAFAGVGPTVVRAPAAEAHLLGAPLTEERVREAARRVAAAVSPVSDLRGSAEYKRAMARLWTERLLRDLGAAP